MRGAAHPIQTGGPRRFLYSGAAKLLIHSLCLMQETLPVTGR
jgi:hypothetical protein